MTDEKLEELSNKLEALMDEYGITNAAWCGGSDNDSKFHGGVIGKRTLLGAVATFANIGRLWQYARERHRALLDTFEI